MAYPKFQEKLEVCRDLLHEYSYEEFMNGSDLDRAKAITGAVNYVAAPDKEELLKSYIKEAYLLHQALSLCSSLTSESDQYRHTEDADLIVAEKHAYGHKHPNE